MNFFSPDIIVAFLTLVFLEIVLGIDNIIFISILTGKLPKEKQAKARIYGLLIAIVFRILLLLMISWIIQAKKPLFSLFHHSISLRDLILAGGGLFLLAKSTREIYEKIEDNTEKQLETKEVRESSFGMIIFQIILLDIVFSFDSILTAIGLTNHILLMIVAIIISMVIMIFFVQYISDFIHQHPSLQILALSFLILIGFMLLLDAVGIHVPKGYIYFAVFYASSVELINLKIKKKKRGIKRDSNQ
jgi:predicted tellurium resistance membrane protein TerC